MAGKGGGAWKVAYADFVTAMMAFFMVMWIVAQNQEVKTAIAEHFSDPFANVVDGEDPTPKRAKAPRGEPKPDRTPDDTKIHGKGVQAVLLTSRGGERTSVGTVVHFAEDSAELGAEGQQRLHSFAALLLGKPQKIEIRGHSSRRPLPAGSPFHDHWELSYARAIEVSKALETEGITRERMRLSQAAGNEPLAVPDETLPGGGYARVEVVMLNETTAVPVSEQAKPTAPRRKAKADAAPAHAPLTPHNSPDDHHAAGQPQAHPPAKETGHAPAAH
jgi:chemotaxis protein MotB